MIDTNSIDQAFQQLAEAKAIYQQAHSEISPYGPAIVIAAGWIGREINRACASAKTGAEWLMAHGGIFRIVGKLFYNKNA